VKDDRRRQGRAAVEALPPSVRIGPHDFAIERVEDCEAHDREMHAEAMMVSQLIRLRENPVSPIKTVESFLHEVLHAIWHTYYVEFDDEEHEELITSQLGTALTSLFRDNRWLTEWIAGSLTPRGRQLDPAAIAAGGFIPVGDASRQALKDAFKDNRGRRLEAVEQMREAEVHHPDKPF
jgi:hypothetical protein